MKVLFLFFFFFHRVAVSFNAVGRTTVKKKRKRVNSDQQMKRVIRVFVDQLGQDKRMSLLYLIFFF